MAKNCLAISNTKGGVGKSTIATNLAAMFSKIGKTLLIDTDMQKSAVVWGQLRSEAGVEPSPMIVQLSGTEVYHQGLKLSAMFDFVIIDTPGTAQPGALVELHSALMLSSSVLIPVNRSGVDSAAMSDIHRALEYVKALNPNLSAKAVLSRVDPRRGKIDEMVEFVSTEFAVPVISPRIHERVAYIQAWEAGQSVVEFGKDKAAARETENLFEEVRKWFS